MFKKKEEMFLRNLKEQLLEEIHRFERGRYRGETDIFDDSSLISDELVFKTRLFQSFRIILANLNDHTNNSYDNFVRMKELSEDEGLNYLLEMFDQTNVLDEIWKLSVGLHPSSLMQRNDHDFVLEICKIVKTEKVQEGRYKTVYLWPGAGYNLDEIKVFDNEASLDDYEDVLSVAVAKILTYELPIGRIITMESDKELFLELEQQEDDENYKYFDLSVYDLENAYLLMDNAKIE